MMSGVLPRCSETASVLQEAGEQASRGCTDCFTARSAEHGVCGGVTLPPAWRPRGTQEGVRHGRLSTCGERALHTVLPGVLQTCSPVASVSLTALTLC